jgi:hypothetical protein
MACSCCPLVCDAVNGKRFHQKALLASCALLDSKSLRFKIKGVVQILALKGEIVMQLPERIFSLIQCKPQFLIGAPAML